MKKYRTSRIKGFMIGILAFLLTFGVGTVFAYWAGVISAPTEEKEEPTVTVGVGENITTSLTITPTVEGQNLVPTNRKDETNTDTVTFTYVVEWTENGDTDFGQGHKGTLKVSCKNLKVNGSDANNGLFTVSINSAETDIYLDQGTVTVVVTIIFATEPETQEIYNQVAGKNITFDVVFKVEPTTNP